MTSPADLLTMVSYLCSIHETCVRCTVWKFYPLFWLSIMAERRFRPLGGVWDRKWRYCSIPLTPIWYRSVFGILRLSLTDQKLFDFFDLHVKCPLKIRRKGYSPLKNFFIDETPKRYFLVANDVVWGINLANRPARSGGGSWQEVKKKLGLHKMCNFTKLGSRTPWGDCYESWYILWC
jgi:hypothetical protein